MLYSYERRMLFHTFISKMAVKTSKATTNQPQELGTIQFGLYFTGVHKREIGGWKFPQRSEIWMPRRQRRNCLQIVCKFLTDLLIVLVANFMQWCVQTILASPARSRTRPCTTQVVYFRNLVRVLHLARSHRRCMKFATYRVPFFTFFLLTRG